MDFDPEREPEAMGTFRAEVRAWLAERMAPAAGMTWSTFWSTRDTEAETAFRRGLGRALGARGWLFPTFPAAYGGGELSSAHHIALESELGRHGLSLGHVFYSVGPRVAPCILRWGTDEQRRAFLPALTRGEVVVWELLTEPQGGSDPATCRTVAVRDGDRYIVTGQKTMVGSKHRADFLWTLVCTDPQGRRHHNLSWLYIPAGAPGISVRPLPMVMGVKNTVFFDRVEVPAFHLVGGENDGWRVSATHLELEHGGAGDIGGDPAVERLVRRCQRDEPGGGRLIDRDDVRDAVADALMESHAVRLMGVRNFWHRLSGQPHPYGGAQYRYYARMVRLRNAQRAQQVLGAEALVLDLAVDEAADFEHLVRSGPGQLHGGGTLDTDRLIVARRLGLGRSGREQAPATL